jgi:hypothetical protein
MVKGYKFGLLYSKTGQSTEEEFYLNSMIFSFRIKIFLLHLYFIASSHQIFQKIYKIPTQNIRKF